VTEEKRFVRHSAPTHYDEVKDAIVFQEGQYGQSLILLVFDPAFRRWRGQTPTRPSLEPILNIGEPADGSWNSSVPLPALVGKRLV
jgi:hypothetical protein